MRRINLNLYTKVTTAEDAGPKGICIIPARVNEIELPPMFFKPTVVRESKDITTANMSSAEWNPAIIIDDRGTPAEYCDLVRWWFAHATEEYVDRLRAQYKVQAFDTEVMKAKAWLLDISAYEVTANGRWSKRKKNIDKYLKNWLGRSYTTSLRRMGGR